MFIRTSGKPHSLGMGEILKNIELRGSTMGSRDEFRKAVATLEASRIVPTVSSTFNNLDEADRAIEKLKEGSQFGKLVISIPASAPKGRL